MSVSFGDLLRQLRRRAGMTQADLAAAVGFSEAQVSRLEKNLRLPNQEVIATVFVAALGLQEEPHLALRLVELAALARGEKPPASLTLQRQERQVVVEEVHATPGHLPIPPTALLGRERDLDAISKRMAGHTGRLFTLIGPPGVGKTRLALALATSLQSLYADGAYFVSLAALSDPDHLPTALITTLGLTDASTKAPRTRLIEFLRHKELLLVLDNFEQISTAASLVADLLAECGGLHLLVTSRAALKVRGEQRYPLTPLELTAAVALFTERAQSLDPTFAPTPASLPTLEAICRRLDCLPLALELSAAQMDLFSPQQLLTALQERRLDLLTSGPTDFPPHHQTLRLAIARSYSLLTAPEQQLFRALGVFAGGFDLAAVAALGFAERALQGLVQKSLVHGAAAAGDQRRFLLLETLRAFATEQLQASGEAVALHQRHAEYYLALTEEAALQLQGPTKAAWLLRLDAELDNLRVAFQWLLQHAPVQAAALAGALKEFWYNRSYYQEGRHWLTQALTAAVGIDYADKQRLGQRARALLALAQLAQHQGDNQPALQWVESSIALYRQAHDQWGEAEALRESGWITYNLHDRPATLARFTESLRLFRLVGDQGKIAALLTSLAYLQTGQELDYEQSTAYLRESIALLRTVNDPDALGFALSFRGDLALFYAHYDEAEASFTEWLALARAMNARFELTGALLGLGKVKLYQGDAAAALHHIQEGLQLAQTIGNKERTMLSWCVLGHVQRALGAWPSAQACYGEALTLSQALENKHVAVECWLSCSAIAIQQKRYALATHLLAASQSLLATLPPYLKAMDRTELTTLVESARTALGEADFATAWALGERWSFVEAMRAAQAFCQTNS
jgi:predicted ATPase/transcriptional regulator with XRE-family HTH domain